MNKKVVFIFFLTLVALVVLYLYSFGPLAGKRIAKNVNPASLKPTQSQKLAVGNKLQAFNAYHNKDLKENYYSVQLPQEWQVQAGTNPGSYSVSFPQGSGILELMDVPDNSTLELFVLSQDEPKLKASLTGYNRSNYQKISVNGNEAYELTYTSQANGNTKQTIRTYISGQDHTELIILTGNQSDFSALLPLFTSIINSFNWENK
jgi:hypothetical protein